MGRSPKACMALQYLLSQPFNLQMIGVRFMSFWAC